MRLAARSAAPAKRKSAVVLVGLSLLASATVLACRSPRRAAASYGLNFIDAMIVHHQAAVAMARLADARALHSELKDFARSVAENQSREIDSMKAWRDRLFPGRPQSRDIMNMLDMAASMKGMDLSMLAALKGDEFDRTFIDMMIPHHRGAIVMSEDALSRAQHPQVKALAQQIIDAQSTEVKMMEGWRTAWAGSVE